MAISEYNTVSALCKTLDTRQSPIARTCGEVSACLSSSRDNYRPFFEQAFPKLLGRIFGFNGVCWLSHLSHNGTVADYHAVLDLLSPTGRLFAAMHAVDAETLVKFHFPSERLPTHTQILLASVVGRAELSTWPQYGDGAVNADSSGRPHVHLNVLCYYLAWFAFYVLRGSFSGDNSQQSPSQSPSSSLAGSVFKAAGTLKLPLRSGHSSQPSGKPFLELLRSYLHHFLPQPASGAASPQSMQNGGLTSPAVSTVTRRSGSASIGEVFYSMLVEWWLCDGDEPLPMPLSQGHPGLSPGQAGNSSPGVARPTVASVPQTFRSQSYEAPSTETLEALTVVMHHVIVNSTGSMPSPAQGLFPWLPLPPVVAAPPQVVGRAHSRPPPALGASGSPSAQALSRRVYRLLKRALSSWPEQRALAPVLTLWLALLAPWRDVTYIPPECRVSSGSQQQGGDSGGGEGGGASGLQRQLTRAASVVLPDSMQLHTIRSPTPATSGRSTATTAGSYDSRVWQSHVLAHLPMFGILVPLAAEAAAARCERRAQESVVCMLRLVDSLSSAPSLVELLDAVETETQWFSSYGGSSWGGPRHRADGAFAELLPWAVDQVEDWEAAASDDVALQPAQPDTIAPQLSMFAVDARGAAPWLVALLQSAESAHVPTSITSALRNAAAKVFPLDHVVAGGEGEPMEAFPPAAATHVKTVRRGQWSDVRYKGDPLKRPIASYEIPRLARLAVRASEAANRALQLDQPVKEGDDPPPGIVQSLLWTARRRGWRVNLRPLAEWRAVLFFIVLWVLLRLVTWPLLRLIYLVITTSIEEPEQPYVQARPAITAGAWSP